MRNPAEPEPRNPLLALSDTERADVVDAIQALGFDINAGDLEGQVGAVLLRPGKRMSTGEARARTGLSETDFDDLRLAAGFPTSDEIIGYTEADLATFSTYAASLDVFSRDEMLNFVRVMSTSLSRVTDAAVSLFSIDVEAPMFESGSTELDVINKQIEALGLLEQVIPVMDTMMRLHMELSSRRRDMARADGASKLRMGIGFLDLVGFTPQSLDLDDAHLTHLLRDFERTAHNVVTDGNGRIVKLIGDEVMFVAVDPEALCSIAARLVEEFSHHDEVTPRGGLAYGDLLSLSGDYYGPVVNLASRIGDLAVPCEVLATPELAAAAPSFTFDPAGKRMLKGFPEPLSLVSLHLPPEP